MHDTSPDDANWFDAETTTFGDRVTGAREAAGLTQPEVAKRLGVKVKTIRAWENDQAEPRANKLGTLAGLLGVSIVWLLAGQGEGPDAPDDIVSEDADLAKILVDLRQMRQEQRAMAERMGLIEKRLRAALANT